MHPYRTVIGRGHFQRICHSHPERLVQISNAFSQVPYHTIIEKLFQALYTKLMQERLGMMAPGQVKTKLLVYNQQFTEEGSVNA